MDGLNEELQKNAPLIDEVSTFITMLFKDRVYVKNTILLITLQYLQVEEMSHQLRALSNKPDQQDVELIKRSDELRERFAAARALLDERRRRLQMADSQGRATFDALDFWLEFFEDALEQSQRGERPPADLEQLKVSFWRFRVKVWI